MVLDEHTVSPHLCRSDFTQNHMRNHIITTDIKQKGDLCMVGLNAAQSNIDCTNATIGSILSMFNFRRNIKNLQQDLYHSIILHLHLTHEETNMQCTILPVIGGATLEVRKAFGRRREILITEKTVIGRMR